MLPVHEKIENSDQKFIIKYIFSFFEKKKSILRVHFTKYFK